MQAPAGAPAPPHRTPDMRELRDRI